MRNNNLNDYKQAFLLSPGLCFIYDKKGILTPNKNALKILGYNENEFYKLSIHDLIINSQDFISFIKDKQSEINLVLKSKNNSLIECNIKSIFIGTPGHEEYLIVTNDKKSNYVGNTNLTGMADDFYKNLLEYSPIPICLISKNVPYYINAKFILTFGYSLEDISDIENWWAQAFPEEKYRNEVRDFFYLSIDEIKKNDIYIHGNIWEIKCKNGEYREIEFKFAPIHNFVLVMCNDLTELNRSKLLLDEVNKKWEMLFNKSLDIILINEKNGNFIHANNSAVDKLEYKLEELFTKKAMDISNAAEFFSFYDIQNAITDQGGIIFETDLISKTGNKIPVEVNLHAILIKSKLTFISICREISLRKKVEKEREELISELKNAIDKTQKARHQAEDAYKEIRYVNKRMETAHNELENLYDKLQKSEERLKLAFDAANDGLFDNNVKTGEIYFSPRFYSMLGFKKDQIESESFNWFDLIHKQDKNRVQKQLNNILEGKKENLEIEFRLQTSNKDYLWILHKSKITKRDENNAPARITGTHVNITERKNAEIEREKLIEKLENALEKAEEANKLKSEFLAVMSHELRTPLNAMLGYSQLLTFDESLNETQKRYANVIYNSGDRLVSLLSDLLEMSIIEAGNVKIKMQIFNIRTMIDDIYILLKDSFEYKNLDFIVNIKTPEEIYSDSMRIRQILFNLIGNAVKFTKQGMIKVSVKKDSKNYIFKIKDTGIGIKDKDKNQIFDMFKQVEDHKKREYGGTGLGLAICKKLVEILKGKIWVKSTQGKGSKFYFSIPIQEVPKKIKKQAKKRDIYKNNKKKKIEILFAEDDNANFMLLDDVIKNVKDFSGTGFSNGQQLINKIKENQNFDIIILDIQMPGLNGVDCLKEIRKLNSKIPVIALTAFAIKDDREKYLNFGFTDYLAKPFSKKKLIDIINKNIG